MKVDPEKRDTNSSLRTLESIGEDLTRFKQDYGGNIKHAKMNNNVIGEAYFTIELDYVRFFYVLDIFGVTILFRVC